MNPSKVRDEDYIKYLIASYKGFTCTEVARCLPQHNGQIAHDSVNRLLERQSHHTETLYQSVKPFIDLRNGFLVLDDTTLDKIYSKEIELVTRHWSGKHHEVVQGINIISLLWTDGNSMIPVDFRVYDCSNDGLTKNDHFIDMIDTAHKRGFQPEYVLFDSWYGSIKNLKKIASFNWKWLTQLKVNRLVNPDNVKNVPVSTLNIPPEGLRVHLRQYGFIKIFKFEVEGKEIEYWATNDENLGEIEFLRIKKHGWKIEEYHRGLKQCCGVENCQARRKNIQLGHIFLSIRAFLCFEGQRLSTGISWYETKKSITRDAIRYFIHSPSIFIS